MSAEKVARRNEIEIELKKLKIDENYLGNNCKL
jgi:hypothetical protein